MILVSQAEVKMLRAGATRPLTVKMGKPRPGAKSARRRWLPGRDYLVVARAVKDEDGKVKEVEQRCRCIVLDVERGDGVWLLRVRGGLADTPVYMSADPAAMRADYTTDQSRAARGEPEVLTQSYEQVIAKIGGQEKLHRDQRRAAIRTLHDAIRELEQAAPSERGSLQRLKAQARKLEAA